MMMRVVCAWCRREGRERVLGEVAPSEDASETHGICPTHVQRVLAQLPSSSFPDVRLLVIVAQGQTELYEHLKRTMTGLTGVQVIMDRRDAERRRRTPSLHPERRRRERRRRMVIFSALGYAMLWFQPPR